MKITIKKVFLVLSLVVLMSPFILPVVKAETLQEQLDKVQKEIDAIKSQKSQLQKQLDSNSYTISGYNSQLSKLYGEADLYKKDIEQLTLEIRQLELNIEALNHEINVKKVEITRSEETIVELDKESDKRIKNSYYNYRMYGNSDGGSTVLVVDDINNYFKDSQYKELIQSDTNNLLVKVALLKEELSAKKQELDEQLINVKKDKETIEIKKVDLDKKNEEVNIKIANYQSQINVLNSQNNNTKSSIQAFSEEEIKKKAQAEQLTQAIFNSFSPVTPGQYVVAGKYIGRQGSTGYSTGPHLHFMVYENNQTRNPCSYLAGGFCGGSDIVKWPLNPVVYFTSGYGNRCFTWNGSTTCDFHAGIDIIGNAWNAPIYAAHDGYLYKGVDGYGALYIIICQNTNCSQGLKTGYWHLSQY